MANAAPKHNTNAAAAAVPPQPKAASGRTMEETYQNPGYDRWIPLESKRVEVKLREESKNKTTMICASSNSTLESDSLNEGIGSNMLVLPFTSKQITVKDVEHDLDTEAEECYIAVDALCEVLQSRQPIIVYFPDFSLWLSRAVSKSNRKEFVRKVHEMLEQLSGPVVLICGQNKVETGAKEKEKFTMILPNLGRLAKLPLPLKPLMEGLRSTKTSADKEIYKLFTNVMSIFPPKEDDQVRIFNRQVLEEHELYCMDLLHVNTDGVILTKKSCECPDLTWVLIRNCSGLACFKCVTLFDITHDCPTSLTTSDRDGDLRPVHCGCRRPPVPSVKAKRLCVPLESLEIAISRLKEQETLTKKPSQNLKNLAKDENENNFVSAVVPPDEIGVKFDDNGALEESSSNVEIYCGLARAYYYLGLLELGKPSWPRHLQQKQVQISSITGSTLTSKWFGDAEKLQRPSSLLLASWLLLVGGSGDIKLTKDGNTLLKEMACWWIWEH
ncbi:hypothetical protein Vadar_022287 [Vaccinium darrowii]|uniref:Uncharacterized protein n=1 Tax=Vaccinium darrowii TaxID=229202 RepID=A0ACB7ZD28_9ERIC|nr:hypothetical protein Vadar_022287 [Vaccinium darrowii]